MEIFVSSLGAETQFGIVIAGWQQPLRIVAPIFDAHVFRRAQVPIQSREARRNRSFYIGNWLSGRFCDCDFDFVAGEFFYPNGKERAFIWIFAAINAFAIRIDESRLQIRASNRADIK